MGDGSRNSEKGGDEAAYDCKECDEWSKGPCDGDESDILQNMQSGRGLRCERHNCSWPWPPTEVQHWIKEGSSEIDNVEFSLLSAMESPHKCAVLLPPMDF